MKAATIYIGKRSKHSMAEVIEMREYLIDEIQAAAQIGNKKRIDKLSRQLYELGKNRRVEWPVE